MQLRSSLAVNELVSAYQLGKPYQVLIIDQQIKTQNPVDLLKKIQKQKNLKLLPILLTSNGSYQEKTALSFP